MNAFKEVTSLAASFCSLVALVSAVGFLKEKYPWKPPADGGDCTIDVLVQALGGKVESVD